MVKRVFFSFHYQDVIDFRANVVRNHWMTKPNREESGFFDASIWESAKKEGDLAIKRLINKGLENTSTTVVLVGTETFKRRWVSYEIIKSLFEGKIILAININGFKDKHQVIKPKGPNPLNYLGFLVSNDGTSVTLHDLVENKWTTYKDMDGYKLKNARTDKGKFHKLSEIYPIYDWIKDNGYNNFTTWVGN